MSRPVVSLFYWATSAQAPGILRDGISPSAEIDVQGLAADPRMNRCWLAKDDALAIREGRYGEGCFLQVKVAESRCQVAEGQFIAYALDYWNGLRGRPRNLKASELFLKLYRVTSVPLAKYVPGMFWSPEVIVEGSVAPESISGISESATA